MAGRRSEQGARRSLRPATSDHIPTPASDAARAVTYGRRGRLGTPVAFTSAAIFLIDRPLDAVTEIVHTFGTLLCTLTFLFEQL